MGGVAPTRRGSRCPRSRFRPRGPNSPWLPPSFARREVVGLRPPFLSAPASPLQSAARAFGAASPDCKGRRLFAGAFRVADGWGARLPGRLFPSGVCRFYRSLVACGVPRAPLRSARGTPQACSRAADPRGRALADARLYPAGHPKRFRPLEPLSPHAACVRSRPRFARPLPRFPWAGSAWLDRSGREPFRLTGLTRSPRNNLTTFSSTAATDKAAADPNAKKDILKGRKSPLPPMRLRRKKGLGGRGWVPLPLLRHHFCAAHKFSYGASPLYPIKKRAPPRCPSLLMVAVPFTNRIINQPSFVGCVLQHFQDI